MRVLLDGVLRVHLDPLDHETDIVGLAVAVEVWKVNKRRDLIKRLVSRFNWQIDGMVLIVDWPLRRANSVFAVISIPLTL